MRYKTTIVFKRKYLESYSEPMINLHKTRKEAEAMKDLLDDTVSYLLILDITNGKVEAFYAQ